VDDDDDNVADDDNAADGGAGRLSINEAGQVDYRAVIDVLNWRQHPVLQAPATSATGATAGSATGGPGAAPASSVWKTSEASSQLVQVVRADALMHDLSA